MSTRSLCVSIALVLALILAGGWWILRPGEAINETWPHHHLLRDLDYTGQGEPRQCLDLYLPRRLCIRPSPVVVFLHAGGWESGGKESADILLPHLIAGTDFAGASLNYRLTTTHRWPAQLADCRAALAWIRANSTRHHLDPDRIVVVGVSAGAHLAAWLGLERGARPLVAGVIAFAGGYDFLSWDARLSVHDPENPSGIIPKLLGGVLSQNHAAAISASPVFHVSREAVPMLLIHGDADLLVSRQQTLEMHATLLAAGASSHLITGINAGHFFLNGPLIQAMRDFIHWRTDSEGAPPPLHQEVPSWEPFQMPGSKTAS